MYETKQCQSYKKLYYETKQIIRSLNDILIDYDVNKSFALAYLQLN